MTRDTLVFLIVGLPVLGMLNATFFGLRLKSFLAGTSRLSSSTDMERYKAQVKAQMFAALVQMILLGAPSLLWMFGFSQDQLYIGDLKFVVVPSVLMIAIGMYFKKVEETARSIPVENDELRVQRDRIASRWTDSALPDW